MKNRAVAPASLSVPLPGAEPTTCGYQRPPFRIFCGAVHRTGSSSARRVRHVDAFLRVALVLRAIEQHHVLLDAPCSSAPPDPRTHRPCRRRRATPASARPAVSPRYRSTRACAVRCRAVPAPTRAGRRCPRCRRARSPCGPPGDRDRPIASARSPRPATPAALVLAVEKVEILLVAIEHHAEIADAADHVSVRDSHAVELACAWITMPRSSHVRPRSVDVAEPMRGTNRSSRPHREAGHSLW